MRTPPDGFRYVTPTEAERAADKTGGRQYRVECVRCGRRIWGSGLGIVAHRRACKGTPRLAEIERRAAR